MCCAVHRCWHISLRSADTSLCLVPCNCIPAVDQVLSTKLSPSNPILAAIRPAIRLCHFPFLHYLRLMNFVHCLLRIIHLCESPRPNNLDLATRGTCLYEGVGAFYMPDRPDALSSRHSRKGTSTRPWVFVPCVVEIAFGPISVHELIAHVVNRSRPRSYRRFSPLQAAHAGLV
ncbi:uncharacterized protein LAESUDRAFT_196341 [Laetiporus sulphureus 93-53]|uniref:Uncharacterized protein n=1 Tax=Laetiporus sulphureus 93-53 TaxID=1314785 RepID=A0A165E1N1_9APHY|nr:uncharacterized protein LAESUDRAFT_196341 [Laetiporus sulphureus 93-53]KZT06075.1 hypothetical protein LAESUDRAFT_196341 [Laetiporus sulphureus 93-53]